MKIIDFRIFHLICNFGLAMSGVFEQNLISGPWWHDSTGAVVVRRRRWPIAAASSENRKNDLKVRSLCSCTAAATDACSPFSAKQTRRCCGGVALLGASVVESFLNLNFKLGNQN